MRKDGLSGRVFQDRSWCSSKFDRWFFFLLWLSEDLSIGRILSERSMGVRGQFLKKRKFNKQNLPKEGKQPPIVIRNRQFFLQRCYSLLVAKTHQNFRSRCLVHEFPLTDTFNNINHGYRAAILNKNSLWRLPFFMAVFSYFFLLWKGAQSEAHCNLSYLLKNLRKLGNIRKISKLPRSIARCSVFLQKR